MPPERALQKQIDDELAILRSAPIAVLRAKWRGVFQSDPPSAFGPDLLRRSLAQRYQERQFGGLTRSAQRDLERTIRALHEKPGRIEVARPIKGGAVLVRQWKGHSYRVTVGKGGFVYNGETFVSLSEIARKITGTRWNGLRVARPSERERDR